MQEFYDIIKLPFALKCWINIWKLAMATYPMMRLCSQEKTKTVNSLKRLLSFNTLLSCQPQKQLALEVSIFNSYSTNCLLLVYLQDEKVKETDLVIIENAIDVLQEKFNTENLLKRTVYSFEQLSGCYFTKYTAKS